MDYRIIINMEFLSFGERCISPITSIFQIELRGKQENPLSRGIGNFPGRTFLLSGGNLLGGGGGFEPLMRGNKNLVEGGYCTEDFF